MLKQVILYVFAIIIFFTGYGFAEDYVGLGAHLGIHHNVGNLDSFDPSIQIFSQNSYFLGFSFKCNYLFLFSRFGADSAFLINKGEVQDSSSEISYSKIYYISFPLFLGYNYKLLDSGNFYMGPGFSYFIARGRIGTSTVGTKDINASGWGYGFIAGIEYKLSNKVDFYFEWEYLNGRSESVLQSQSTRAWDDFYVDFTGHRLIFGARYYLVQL